MNPLNRPMFVSKFNTGGSVYIPPALRYMAQNPDVFNASIANADARGLQGLARQAQIERDAALHYAFHGQPEGRAYGGRTFLGGLLEPRLGDTFGLSPERRAELEAPPPAEPDRALPDRTAWQGLRDGFCGSLPPRQTATDP